MNHIYRLKKNRFTQQVQAVPETARSAGKGRSAHNASTATGLAHTMAGAVVTAVASVVLGGVASLAHAQQAPPAAHQLPQGGVVTRGSANINTSTAAGNALMTVNQASQRAVIDWASFNVGSQAKVQFNQPGTSAVVLNQIQGNNASQIFGQISANGQVILSNPNGVYFSPTASVDVGSLVATTGKANADDFMAGKASFRRDGSTGSVVNEGQLKAALGGYIALLAPEVRNQGVIVAQAGTVALATGEAITLSFNNAGTGLTGITTTPQTIAALVENRSAVLAEGGQIILSAHALAALQGALVKNSGQLSASSLTQKGGKVVLMADKIELTGTSRIEANGPQGGGTVLVGGDWQGSGDTRQATQVTMAQGASIKANATGQGDGGKVVLWSDVHNASGVTQVDGRIEAKGAGSANKGGNGGQVETSGYTLNVGEQLKLSTQASGSGAAGQWLLDPANITISTSGTEAGSTNSSGTFTPNSGVTNSVIRPATIEAALVSGDVTISTTNTGAAGTGGSIAINSPIYPILASGVSRNLSFISDGAIAISNHVDATTGGSAGALNVMFKAASTISQTEFSVKTNGGRAVYWANALSDTGAGGILLGSNASTSTNYGSVITNGGDVVMAGGLGTNLPGGPSNSSANGVMLKAYSKIDAGTGNVTVRGDTANSTSISGTGLFVESNAQITGKDISLTGKGSPITNSGNARGILIATNVTISATRNIQITGDGGASPSSTALAYGIFVSDATSLISSSGGDITLTGTGYRSGSLGVNLLGTVRNTSANGNISIISNGFGIGSAATTVFALNAGNLTINGFTDSSSYTGVISGSGNVFYAGTGVLTVTGNAASTYTGGTTVTSGTLKLGNATALGTGTTGTVIVGNGGALDLNGLTIDSTNAKALTLSGTGVSSGGALLNSSTSSAATYPGLLSLAADASIIAGQTYSSSSIVLSHTGTITGSGFALTLGGTGSSSRIDGIIGTATGALTKNNSGTWTLKGVNTYAGDTLVNAGTLAISNVSGLGSSAVGTTLASGATLAITGLTGLAENITLNGGTLINTGTSSITGNIALTASNTITGSDTLIINGNISGQGGLTLTQSANSDLLLVLKGNNSYSGSTTVNSGGYTATLQIASSTALGSTSQITLQNSGMLDMNGYSLNTAIPLTLRTNYGVSIGNLINTSATPVAYAGPVSLVGNGYVGTPSTAGAITLNNSTAITGSSNAKLILTGNGVLDSVVGSSVVELSTKNIGDKWILTRDNLYTGATTVAQGGSLQIGNGSGSASLPATSIITIASGGKLAYNLPNVTSLSNTINFEYQSSSIANLAYGSTLDLSGVTFTYLRSGTPWASPGNTFTSTLNETVASPTVAKIVLPATPTLTGSVFNVDTSGYQSAFTSVQAIIWTGAASGTPSLKINGKSVNNGVAAVGGRLTKNTNDISIEAGALWSLSNTPTGTIYYTSTTDNAGATLTGNATATLLPGYEYTQSGNITGSYSLSVTGGGTLTLSGANAYTGGTSISSAMVKAGSSTALGTGAVTVNSGAALDLNGQNITSAGALTLSGTGLNNSGALSNSSASAASYSAGVTLAANASVDVTSGGSLTLGGIVSGSSKQLTKTGAGTLTLNGANTYTGGTNINGGTLALGSAGALGPSGTISFGGGTLKFSASNTIDYSSRFSSNAGQQYVLDTNGQNVTLASNLTSSTGTLTKLGSGTLTLGGASSTFSGGTTVYAGTLSISADRNLGAVPDTATTNLTLATGTTLVVVGQSSAVTLAANRGIVLTGNARIDNTSTSNTLTIAGPISGSYSLTAGGTAGATTILTSASTFTGGLTINSGITLQLGDGTSTGTLSASTITNNGTLTFNQCAASTVASNIYGDGAVTVNGTGTVTLSGSNAFTGGTTVNSGATLQISSDGNLGVYNQVSPVTSLTLNGGTLAASGQSTDLIVGLNRRISIGASGGTLANLSNSYALRVYGNVTATGPVTLVGGNMLALTSLNTTGATGTTGAVTQTSGNFTATSITAGGAVSLTGGTLSVSSLTSPGAVTLMGSGITVGDISTSGSGAAILFKSTGSIAQNASTTVSSAGGNITYWADSDGSGDGGITLSSGNSVSNTRVTSSNGNIVLGGGAGASAVDGAARAVYGVLIGSYANLQAGAGSLSILGTSNSSNAGSIGVSVGGYGSLSAANISITGSGYDNTSNSSRGVSVGYSSITASQQLSISGTGGGTAVTSTSAGGNDGIRLDGTTVEATGSGNVLITATGGGTGAMGTNTGLTMFATLGDAVIRSQTGTVTVNAVGGAGTSTGLSTNPGIGRNVIFGGAAQSGALTLRADNWTFGNTAITQVQSNEGAVKLEPLSASSSFSAGGLDTSNLSITGATSLTLGKAGNTARINLGSSSATAGPVTSYSVAGPVNLYGDVYLGSSLTTTGTGTVNGLISITGPVSQIRGGMTAPYLLLTGAGASNVSLTGTNTIGTVAGSGLGSVSINNGSLVSTNATGALTVGTVGTTHGLSATGAVTVTTYKGNLTLNDDIVTTDATTSAAYNARDAAVTLNAGQYMAVGDATSVGVNSGSVILNGGTITMGAGGRALIYTGSVASSTGVSSLVPAGNFRYGSTYHAPTMQLTNFTQMLGTVGYYAIYRERPTVSWTTTGNQTLSYGVTPVTPAANAVSGLANGDTLDANLTVRLASNNATVASTNLSGYYNVGNYIYSRTQDAKALGYLVSNPQLNITPATLTVKANDASKVYNGLGYSIGATYGYTISGFAPGDTAWNAVSGTPGYWSGSPAQGAVNAGSYAITPTAGTLSLKTSNYALAYANGTLTVNKAPLTVRINNDARFLTEQDNILTTPPTVTSTSYAGAIYSGFVANQSTANLSGGLIITRVGGDTAAGVYTGVLTGSGLTSANYSFNYVPGNYTIVPADQLLVKLANIESTYSSTPAYTISSAKYFRSSTQSVVDLTSNVVINGSLVSLNDGAGGNTSFTVGALSPSLSSGGKLSVGAYQLGAASILNTSGNYSNTMTVTGALQVNPMAVSASVSSSVTKAYDASLKMNALTLGLSGAVSGDLLSASGTGAYVAKDAGTGLTYNVVNIGLSGADARNYVLTDSVSHVPSNTLTGSNGVITAVPLLITANNASKVYDGALYSGADSVTYSGFVSNEDASALTGSLSYGGTSRSAINAGNYSITPSGLSSTNYTITYGDGSLVISPAGLTVMSGSVVAPVNAPISKVYDGTNTATLTSANYNITGWAFGEGATVTKTTGTYDGADAGTGKTVTVMLSAADYVATGGTNLANYYLPTSVSGAVGVITPKPVTVTSTSRSTTYDAVTPYSTLVSGTQFTTSALVGADAVSAVTHTVTGVTPSAVAQAGSFAVTPSAAAMGTGLASNYNFTYVPSTHTVDKANLEVTASSLTATPSLSGNVYNNNAYTGTYTINALGNDASAITVTGVATGINAGTYTSSLAVTGAALSNYNTPVITNADLVISPKPVTVSNTSRSTTYDAVSTYGALASGTQFTSTALVGSDAVGSVTQTASGTGVTASGVAQAGSFAVTPSAAVLSTGTAGNYSFSYVDSTHTVNPAVVTVTPINGALQGTVSKVYDGTNTATLNGNNYLLTGWVNGESATVTKTSGTYDNANAGTGKTVTVNLTNADYAAMGSTSLSNYTLPTTISGAVGVISKASLMATGNSLSSTYNGADQSVAGFTVSGLQGNDTVASLSSVTATGVTAKNAGSYANTVSAGTETNYTVSTVNGSLVISPKPVTVTNTTRSTTYDGTSSYGFLANGTQFNAALVAADTVVSVTQTASGTGVTPSGVAQAGSFAVTPSAAVLGTGLASNYDFSYVASTHTVDKANLALTATASLTGNVYNGTAYTGTYTSNALGSDASAMTVTGMATGTNAGTYTSSLAVTGTALSNYNTPSISNANLVISKAPLTVRVNDDARFVGLSDTAGYAGVSYSGFVGGESSSVLGGAAAVTRSTVGPDGNTAGSNGLVGRYTAALTASGLTSNNYTISYAPGSYTVVPADQLLVKVLPSSGTYGTAASYVVGTAQYLNNNNVVVDLSVSSQGANTFTAVDGLGGSVTFTVLPSASALSGGGRLKVGAYSLGASNVSVTAGSNFSNTLNLVGTQTVNPAALSAAPAVSKVYDGSTAIASQTMPVSGALANDLVQATGSGQFASKNVGTGLGYTLSSLGLSGADAGNYYLSNGGGVSASNGSITRLPQVSWVGGATGNWFDPANWAGGAVPDLANVAVVSIPAGVTVSFGNAVVSPAQAGPVSLDALGTAGNLSISGGTLNVGAGGVNLGTLTQSGGQLSATGAVNLGSLNQIAGSLSAGALNTTTSYVQTGNGTVSVTGPARIASTRGGVVLGQLSVGGDLLVASTDGSITQTSGTRVTAQGNTALTASHNGQPADVLLGNADNVLTGSVRVSGADVRLATTSDLSVSVQATGDASLSSTGRTTLGTSTVGGDLQVSTAHADIAQSGPVQVGGQTSLNAGTGRVQLTDPGNHFVGALTVQASASTVTGADGGQGDQTESEIPGVLEPKLKPAESAYQVTVLKLPKLDEAGAVHIAVRDLLVDAQIPLPDALQAWLKDAGNALSVDGDVSKGVSLSPNGASLRVAAQAAQRWPVNLVLRSAQGQLAIRLVKAP